MKPCLTHRRYPGESHDEKSLLERVRQREPGWESTRSRLLERHATPVYRRCLQRMGNVHDAEDALQETMLRALHGIHAFEGRSGLRTWLFAIADNECFSLIRRRERLRHSDHLRHQLRIHEENRRVPTSFDPEKRRGVQNTLTRLPPKAREVLGLRFYREASLEEISRILGISLSAAKMRLYRALDQFEAFHEDRNGIDPCGSEGAATA